MNTETVRSAVFQLSRLPGVRGAMVVDAQVGVPVVSELMHDVNGTAVAALAASLFQRGAQATASSDFGSLTMLQLEAETGNLFVTDAGELLVAVVTEKDAQLGLLRMELATVVEALR